MGPSTEPSLVTAMVIVGRNRPAPDWDVYIHRAGGGVEVCAVTRGEDEPRAWIDTDTDDPAAEYRVGIYQPHTEDDFFSMTEVSALDLAAHVSAELIRAAN
jgi:hypothetical protein